MSVEFIEFEDVIREGQATFELNVVDPTQTGVAASVSTIGTSLDQNQWVKVGSNDTDWKRFVLSDSVDGVLDDISSIGSPTLSGQFITSTGAGQFAYVGPVASDEFEKLAGTTGDNLVSSDDITTIVKITQANYDLLPSPDDNTLYIIV
jgi:hypothetical protein